MPPALYTNRNQHITQFASFCIFTIPSSISNRAFQIAQQTMLMHLLTVMDIKFKQDTTKASNKMSISSFCSNDNHLAIKDPFMYLSLSLSLSEASLESLISLCYSFFTVVLFFNLSLVLVACAFKTIL